jgi:tyrosyl-tRNA synthetase
MLMQATDYLELSRRHGCALQMGGSDQWGNIVNGVELIRRVSGKTAFGLTTPLLATGSGQKMGKTLGGAVWLNAERLSPYDYWQMWRNTEDGDVGRFLRLFTELPLDEIARLEALGGAEINEAKKVLANEATRLLHGSEAAEAAAGAAKAAFEEGRLSEDLPTVEVSAGDLASLSNTALMVLAGFATSNSDARRQIAGGGFRIDGEKVADANAAVKISGQEAELRKGNARKRLVVK